MPKRQVAAVAVGLVALLAGGCGGQSLEEQAEAERRSLIERGCAVGPGFGDESINGVLARGLDDHRNDPIRDEDGEYCPGGAQREAAAQTAALEKEKADAFAKIMAEEGAELEEQKRQKDVAFYRLKYDEAWTTYHQLKLQDFEGSLPNAESGFQEGKRDWHEEMAYYVERLEEVGEQPPSNYPPRP